MEQPEKPKNLTRDFYEQDPRSSEIRETSVQILKKINQLIHDGSVRDKSPEYFQLHSDIEKLSGELIHLGIKPGMNTGRPRSEYRTDPVLAAEWAAGQLLQMTGRNFDSAHEVIPIIEEHNEMDSGGEALINLSTAPKKYLDFTTEVTILHFLRGVLDAVEETSISTV